MCWRTQLVSKSEFAITLTADADRLTECLVSKSSECSAMERAIDLLVTLLMSLFDGTVVPVGTGEYVSEKVPGVEKGRGSWWSINEV